MLSQLTWARGRINFNPAKGVLILKHLQQKLIKYLNNPLFVPFVQQKLIKYFNNPLLVPFVTPRGTQGWNYNGNNLRKTKMGQKLFEKYKIGIGFLGI